MKSQILKNIIEISGYQHRPYRGRGMFGNECIGVSLNLSPFEFFADLLISVESQEEASVVDWAMRSAKTDSIGRGEIVYFPDMLYSDKKF